MDILLLLTLFQVKHYLSDFVFQTYAQTVHKGKYGNPIGISHSLDHIVASAIILWIYSFFYPVTILNIVYITILEGIIHYHIDWIKVKYGSKDTHSSLFWNQFGLDQLAHQLTYISAVYYICL